MDFVLILQFIVTYLYIDFTGELILFLIIKDGNFEIFCLINNRLNEFPNKSSWKMIKLNYVFIRGYYLNIYYYFFLVYKEQTLELYIYKRKLQSLR